MYRFFVFLCSDTIATSIGLFIVLWLFCSYLIRGLFASEIRGDV